MSIRAETEVILFSRLRILTIRKLHDGAWPHHHQAERIPQYVAQAAMIAWAADLTQDIRIDRRRRESKLLERKELRALLCKPLI